jgi:hypothetical protein
LQLQGEFVRLLVIITIEGSLAGIVVEGLIICSALISAIDHFFADAADGKRLFLHAFLAVALQLLILTLIRLEELTDLHHQRMRAFDVLIYVFSLISLLSQLSAFNQEGLILDRLEYSLDDWISGDIAESLPEPDPLGSVYDLAVIRKESLEFLDGPQIGEDKLIVGEDGVVVGLFCLLDLLLQPFVLQVGYHNIALQKITVIKSTAFGDADGPAQLVASVVA